jgi:predicted RNase H-like nuclease (RuvC/YqgF family)
MKHIKSGDTFYFYVEDSSTLLFEVTSFDRASAVEAFDSYIKMKIESLDSEIEDINKDIAEEEVKRDKLEKKIKSITTLYDLGGWNEWSLNHVKYYISCYEEEISRKQTLKSQLKGDILVTTNKL